MIELLAAVAILPSTIPLVGAKAAVILDEGTGRVLWGRNVTLALPPASTTKVLTALLVIENCSLDEVVTAPPSVEKVEGASIVLQPGERMTVKDLLHAILLKSANDACIAAAHHVSGSVSEFARLMNTRASQLGCTNSNFQNPHGLTEPDHRTSAKDLATISREAMKHPIFQEIVRKRKYELDRSINQKVRLIASKNVYLDSDPTADGIKTGWTVAAGHCYVGSATRNGQRVITVLLNSPDWKGEHARMLNWAFENFQPGNLIESGTVVGVAPIEQGSQQTVRLVAGGSVSGLLQKGHAPKVSLDIRLDRPLVAPVAEGTVVGSLEVTDEEGAESVVPLLVESSVERRRTAKRWSYFLMATAIGTGAYWMNWAVELRGRRCRKNS